MSKVIRSIWLVSLLAIFSFALPILAGMSAFAIAYDGQTQPSIGYDRSSLPASDYDSASSHITNEKENRSGGNTGVFGNFSKFLAAESGASSAAQGAMLRTQLAAEEAAGAQMPKSLTGYLPNNSYHGLDQAISRPGGGVSPQAILDAWNNPLNITGQSNGRFLMQGQNASIVVNSQGKIITTWANGSAGLRTP